MSSRASGEARIIPDQDLGGIPDPEVTRTVPSSATMRGLLHRFQSAAADPSSFGGTVALWQRLAVPFNESHYIRIYYVSSWFRSVSEFINMLND